MKKLLLIFILMLLVILPVSAFAQSPVALAQVQIGLWPEFDRQDMLVIYHIQLPADTPLPVDLTFHIPASAGEPNAVAVQGETGLLSVAYEMETEGAWTAVSFQSDSLQVQLEYYDPSLDTSSAARTFTYTWPGDYAVENLVIEVQQPPNTTEMQLHPAYDTAQVGSDGLTYYSLQTGALDPSQTYNQQVNYTKTDDTLTITTMNAPEGQQALTSTGVGFNWRWLLIAAAVGLIGYGVYGILAGRRKGKRRPKKKTAAKTSVFCQNCGAPAQKGDQFCRQCGTKLRR